MSGGALAGRVALVSGSSRGIGRAIAERFAREGADVAITWHRSDEAADALARRIEKEGGRAVSLQLDVTERASIRRCIDRTIEAFGQLDVVVNNAGFLEQKPFATISDADWDHTFDVNLKSAFVFAQELGPHFESRGVGNIVNATLPPGSDGAAMKDVYRDVIFPALEDFSPDVLLISAGFDADYRDPLAQLNWRPNDFAWITGNLLEIAGRKWDGRVVSMLEGGYDREGLATGAGAHVSELMGRMRNQGE